MSKNNLTVVIESEENGHEVTLECNEDYFVISGHGMDNEICIYLKDLIKAAIKADLEITSDENNINGKVKIPVKMKSI